MKESTRSNHENKNIVGHKIKQLRLEKGLTQQNLIDSLKEDEIYLDQKSISAIECGLRKVFDFELLALSKCLEVQIDEFFCD